MGDDLIILGANVPCDISGILKLNDGTGKYDFGDYKIKMATGRSYDRNQGSPIREFIIVVANELSKPFRTTLR